MHTNRQLRHRGVLAKAGLLSLSQETRLEFSHCQNDEPVKRFVTKERDRGFAHLHQTTVHELRPTGPIFSWRTGDPIPPTSIRKATRRERELIEAGKLTTCEGLSALAVSRWRNIRPTNTVVLVPTRRLLNSYGIGPVEPLNVDQLGHDLLVVDALLYYIDKHGDQVLTCWRGEHTYKRRFKGVKVFDACLTYHELDDITPASVKHNCRLCVESLGRYSPRRVDAFVRHWIREGRVDAVDLW